MSRLMVGQDRGGLAALLQEEAGLARREIRAGRFQRTMALLAAFAAIVSGFEAYAQHLRGAFRHWLMWTPVALTLPTVITASVALFSERSARTVLPVVSLISIADGVIGFVYHVRGVQALPGGFRLGQYNIVIGPPLFAPLLVCIVGILGLFASLLRRESARSFTPKSRGLLAGLATEVSPGRFQQELALTLAGLAILSGGEAYFEHLRGSFNQRLMWTPVWLTPPMVAAAVGAAKSPSIARDVLPLASAVTFFDGLLGFGLHLRGLRRMPGSWANLSFNVIAGPPMFAPLLFAAVGLLGFISSLLRRGNDR